MVWILWSSAIIKGHSLSPQYGTVHDHVAWPGRVDQHSHSENKYFPRRPEDNVCLFSEAWTASDRIFTGLPRGEVGLVLGLVTLTDPDTWWNEGLSSFNSQIIVDDSLSEAET